MTKQTFDAYLYQLVEGKQKFASQIMTSKSPVRSAEDIDETALSYAEIKMLATGNPYIKEKMDLDIQVQKLKLLKSNFLSEKYSLEDKIIKYYPQRITSLENRIAGLEKDVETAKQHPKPMDDRFVGMEVQGAFYSEKADAGKAIIDACKQMTSPEAIPLGKYRGFDLELYFDSGKRTYCVTVKLSDQAGLKRITIHGLRHSHVSLLISKKYDIFEVSKRIGHKSVKTTQDIYGHLFDDVQKSIANDLNMIRRGGV